MTRPITFTLNIAGIARTIQSRDGASVEIALSERERREVELGVKLLREQQGARVSLDMPAVDGLLLELVSVAEGEGPFAKPAKFTINRFGDLVTREEMRQVQALRPKLALDLWQTRLSDIRVRMRQATIDVLYVEDVEPELMVEVFERTWRESVRIQVVTTRDAGDAALERQPFQLGLFDVHLRGRTSADSDGLELARRHRDRMSSLIFVSASADDLRADLAVVRPDSILKKPCAPNVVMETIQRNWSMVLGAGV